MRINELALSVPAVNNNSWLVLRKPGCTVAGENNDSTDEVTRPDSTVVVSMVRSLASIGKPAAVRADARAVTNVAETSWLEMDAAAVTLEVIRTFTRMCESVSDNRRRRVPASAVELVLLLLLLPAPVLALLTSSTLTISTREGSTPAACAHPVLKFSRSVSLKAATVVICVSSSSTDVFAASSFGTTTLIPSAAASSSMTAAASSAEMPSSPSVELTAAAWAAAMAVAMATSTAASAASSAAAKPPEVIAPMTSSVGPSITHPSSAVTLTPSAKPTGYAVVCTEPYAMARIDSGVVTPFTSIRTQESCGMLAVEPEPVVVIVSVRVLDTHAPVTLIRAASSVAAVTSELEAALDPSCGASTESTDTAGASPEICQEAFGSAELPRASGSFTVILPPVSMRPRTRKARTAPAVMEGVENTGSQVTLPKRAPATMGSVVHPDGPSMIPPADVRVVTYAIGVPGAVSVAAAPSMAATATARANRGVVTSAMMMRTDSFAPRPNALALAIRTVSVRVAATHSAPPTDDANIDASTTTTAGALPTPAAVGVKPRSGGGRKCVVGCAGMSQPCSAAPAAYPGSNNRTAPPGCTALVVTKDSVVSDVTPAVSTPLSQLSGVPAAASGTPGEMACTATLTGASMTCIASVPIPSWTEPPGEYVVSDPRAAGRAEGGEIAPLTSKITAVSAGRDPATTVAVSSCRAASQAPVAVT